MGKLAVAPFQPKHSAVAKFKKVSAPAACVMAAFVAYVEANGGVSLKLTWKSVRAGWEFALKHENAKLAEATREMAIEVRDAAKRAFIAEAAKGLETCWDRGASFATNYAEFLRITDPAVSAAYVAAFQTALPGVAQVHAHA